LIYADNRARRCNGISLVDKSGIFKHYRLLITFAFKDTLISPVM